MRKKKKHIIIGALIVIVGISTFLICNMFPFIRMCFQLLIINKSLPAVSCDFYSDPIEDITFSDIVYKKRENLELKLDIYEANKKLENGNPVIVYVYGDGWVNGSKTLPNSIKPLIDVLRNEGFTVISTSYELMKCDVIFDKQISDIKDTIRWIYKNQNEYNFDTSKIGIISPSAGAQLSMIAAYSDKNDFKGDESLWGYDTKIQYIIDMFGPAVLSQINLDEAPDDIVSMIDKNQIEELSEKYSPINHLKENLPDTLIIHSKSDNLIPYETSVQLYEEARELDNNFELYTLENCSHYLENLSEQEAFQLYLKISSFIISKTNSK